MPKKKTHEDFITQLKIKNPNIKVLGNYVNARTKIEVKCLVDEHIWYSTPDNLLHGYGCPKCAGKGKTTESFIKELSVSNPDIKILGKYKTNDSKIKCYCEKHKYVFYATPSHLLSGQGCKICRSEKIKESITLSQMDFVQKLNAKNGNIDVIGKYISSHDKLLVRCKECNRKWYIIPNNALVRGVKCTCCKKDNISRGETIIFDTLNKYNVNFIYQFSFTDLFGVNNGLLSYDFYLPTYNLLIEFQGEQHEHCVDYFGGKEKFKIQQEHDKRKREYAKEYNINLLEIWYWDFDNIESIITENLHLKAS